MDALLSLEVLGQNHFKGKAPFIIAFWNLQKILLYYRFGLVSITPLTNYWRIYPPVWLKVLISTQQLTALLRWHRQVRVLPGPGN